MTTCPFCNHDPYEYVDIGVGMQPVAVTCCSLGIALFDHRSGETVTLDREEFSGVAATISRLTAERGALQNTIDVLESNARVQAKLLADTGRERDEARQLVSEANNSLYGSHGYFYSLNGGPFDHHHLARGIEDLKETCRKASRLTAERDRAETMMVSFAAEASRLRNALTLIDDAPCSMVNDSESLRHTIKTIQQIARQALATPAVSDAESRPGGEQ